MANPTKNAADLAKGDLVQVGVGDWRYVVTTAFTDKPTDGSGTTGVRIWWEGHEQSSVIAADKVMTLAPLINL